MAYKKTRRLGSLARRPVFKPVRLEDFSPRQLNDYLDSLAVLADARRGYALGLDAEGRFSRLPVRGVRHAARVRKVPFYKVERYVRSELFRDRKGRIRVTPADRLPRPMQIPTVLGDQPIVVRGSRKASLLAKLRIALLSGDEVEFERLRKKIKNQRIAGQELPDFKTLQAALDAGAVDPAEIYAATQGGGVR
jgi:hypothetical protein